MYRFLEQAMLELKRIKCLQGRMKRYNEELLKGSITGCLRKNGKVAIYYDRTSTVGDKRIRNRMLIGDTNSAEVRAMAEARYLKKLDDTLTRNRHLLEKLVNKYKSYSQESILSEMPSLYSKVIFANRQIPIISGKNQIISNNDIIAEARANTSSDDSPISDSEKNTKEFQNTHYAITGEPVRSKNEAIIYNMLYSYGIPFKYDAIIRVRDEAGMTAKVSPDFVIRAKDGSLILYEHLGMLKEMDYRIKFAEKLWIYGINGYNLWENFFISTDGVNNSINTAAIDRMIRDFILPLV